MSQKKTIQGVVVVITSAGAAYQTMEAAWVVNWRRHTLSGIHLILLDDGDEDSIDDVEAGVSRMRVAGSAGLIPGVLDKTHEAFKLILHRFPGSWVFRTNLSSHIRLGVLKSVMDKVKDSAATSVGFSPHHNHLSGAGVGLNAAAVTTMLNQWHVLDRSLIDDLAMSAVLLQQTCIVWTGRLDHVWPDGTHRLGVGPLYHVRVKTQDRYEDANTLLRLALDEYFLT